MKNLSRALLPILFLAALGLDGAARADNYALDPAHAGINFKISHLGLSWIYGRFNDFSADFVIDTANPEKSSFNMAIKTDSIDTNNKKRDDHLRSPDFFNTKQFPLIAFKSTKVVSLKNLTSLPPGGIVGAQEGFQVTGDFTLHGETKSITFVLAGGKTAEFPKGVQRTGYTTELTLKRAEFGMKGFEGALGQDVHVSISFEAVKK